MTEKPEEGKKFSAEDLAAVDDSDADDGASSAAAAADAGKSASDDASKTSKAQDTADKDASEQGSGTFFEGDDDDDDASGDDTSDGDDKGNEADKAAKSKDEDEAAKNKDWRQSFIEKALKGKEDTLTASKLAKRKESLLAELGRYKTPEDYMIAGLAAREKIRSGEYKRSKLSDEASEEEVAAWRKENGIPEAPEKYDIPKIPGHVWTEHDDPFLDTFKETAHKSAFTQEQVDAATKWYAATTAEMQDKYIQQVTEIDKKDREITRDAIRAELGNTEFRQSISLMERLMKDKEVMPADLGEKILTARYQDDEGNSRRLINNPEMAKLMMTLAYDTYGDGVLLGGDASSGGKDRKKEIEEVMATDINEYYRKGLDKELAEITARDEASSRKRRR